MSDGADYPACFEAAYDCTAAWRALGFVPLHGRLLDVRAYDAESITPVSPATDINVMTSICIDRSKILPFGRPSSSIKRMAQFKQYFKFPKPRLTDRLE
jgi:hypothetical protein